MARFKLLLVVGTANDIFIYNMAKWLKNSMEIDIDVYEFFPASQQSYGTEYYNQLISAPQCNVRYLKTLINPIIQGKVLDVFLRDKQYDVIHLHWITASHVMAKAYKQHCKKLFMTFWGREYANMSICLSNKLYRKHLNRVASTADCIINSNVSLQRIKSELPTFRGALREGGFGSGPLEALYDLMDKESKEESKRILGFPAKKLSVMIGYSGKRLHQHLDIIRELNKYEELKNKVHLFAPMTRGADNDYTKKVHRALEGSGFSYTILKGYFLTDEEVGRIRNATDIVLQLSTTDGFSNSIIECLCGKAVMIYGDWLNYSDYLKKAKFQAICVASISESIKMLTVVAQNMGDYSKISALNSENGRHRAFWSERIHDWVDAYNEL